MTKSGSKFLSVGVELFEGYAPTVKINNPELTSTAIFSIQEFLKNMGRVVEDVEILVLATRAPEGQILKVLSHYAVLFCKNKTLQFIPRYTSVYKSLYLATDTVKTILHIYT